MTSTQLTFLTHSAGDYQALPVIVSESYTATNGAPCGSPTSASRVSAVITLPVMVQWVHNATGTWSWADTCTRSSTTEIPSPPTVSISLVFPLLVRDDGDSIVRTTCVSGPPLTAIVAGVPDISCPFISNQLPGTNHACWRHPKPYLDIHTIIHYRSCTK